MAKKLDSDGDFTPLPKQPRYKCPVHGVVESSVGLRAPIPDHLCGDFCGVCYGELIQKNLQKVEPVE